jgi:hypothetical protein
MAGKSALETLDFPASHVWSPEGKQYGNLDEIDENSWWSQALGDDLDVIEHLSLLFCQVNTTRTIGFW